MKKIIIAASVLLLIASAGCNNSNDSSDETSSKVSAAEEISQSVQESSSGEASSPESSSESKTGDSVLSKYVDVNSLSEKSRKTMTEFFSSEQLTIGVEGSLAAAKGLNVNFGVKITKDADRSYVKFSFMNTDYATLTTKDGVYSLNEAKKTAVFTPTNSGKTESSGSSLLDSTKSSLPAFQTFDISALSFIKDGEEEFEGNSYFCEEYSAGEFTLKAYYDEDAHIKFITGEKDGLVSVLRITELAQTADSSLLEIPSDYTIK